MICHDYSNKLDGLKVTQFLAHRLYVLVYQIPCVGDRPSYHRDWYVAKQVNLKTIPEDCLKTEKLKRVPAYFSLFFIEFLYLTNGAYSRAHSPKRVSALATYPEVREQLA